MLRHQHCLFGDVKRNYIPKFALLYQKDAQQYIYVACIYHYYSKYLGKLIPKYPHAPIAV